MRQFFVWGTLFFFFSIRLPAAQTVTITDSDLIVDGKTAPYLFGAELQYFRARGGPGRNVSPAKVDALWKKLISRAVEAGMNTVTFYIPWDFHEPVEGKFDFDGKLDQDQDGNPDYPSRNLKRFLRLVEQSPIQYVMLRPGPYINAEWGPEGFGAIPKWFLDKYPQALAVTQSAGKPRTASFAHPLYRDRVRKWFFALHQQVLQHHMGNAKIAFLQIDNETNYFWDSIYERDWHPSSIARYRSFLKKEYGGEIAKLNEAYGSTHADFQAVAAPHSKQDVTYPKRAWHYDWQHFHDVEIRDYYRFLKNTWAWLGVKEPQVLFTSCDSFNAPPDGNLPRLDYRQQNRHSLTTMNIYPKTFGTSELSILNQPMKAAHDANLVAAAHRQYYGTAGNWVMSTETMGGWFPPTEVTLSARQHTYGSLVASGIKALVIYYFHEGWNWTGKEETDTELSFDAPLDKDLNARPQFYLMKDFGRALGSGLGELAMTLRQPKASILLAHDSRTQYNFVPERDALTIASTDSAALFGFLREAGYEPELGFLDAMSQETLNRYPVVAWDSPGFEPADLKRKLEAYEAQGGKILRENPAKGWNEDGYVKLADAKERLDEIRHWLRQTRALPEVKVNAKDGKPFVHVWLRQGEAASLVAVENFLPEARDLDVQLPEPLKHLPWEQVWGPRSEVSVSANGVAELHVAADAITLWKIRTKQ